MGYEAAGKDVDALLDELDKEPSLSPKTKHLMKKIRDAQPPTPQKVPD